VKRESRILSNVIQLHLQQKESSIHVLFANECSMCAFVTTNNRMRDHKQRRTEQNGERKENRSERKIHCKKNAAAVAGERFESKREKSEKEAKQ
jgi:hypothetical protein